MLAKFQNAEILTSLAGIIETGGTFLLNGLRIGPAGCMPSLRVADV